MPIWFSHTIFLKSGGSYIAEKLLDGNLHISVMLEFVERNKSLQGKELILLYDNSLEYAELGMVAGRRYKIIKHLMDGEKKFIIIRNTFGNLVALDEKLFKPPYVDNVASMKSAIKGLVVTICVSFLLKFLMDIL